jgi:hypothetical protein
MAAARGARLGQVGFRGSGAVLEAPALVAGLDDVAVVGQAVEQRCLFHEVMKMLANESVNREDRTIETESTIRVLGHLAYAVGVPPGCLDRRSLVAGDFDNIRLGIGGPVRACRLRRGKTCLPSMSGASGWGAVQAQLRAMTPLLFAALPE